MSFGVDVYRTLIDEYFIADYELAVVYTSTDGGVTAVPDDAPPIPDSAKAVFRVGNPEHDTVCYALRQEGYKVDPVLGTQLIKVTEGDE